MVYNDFYLVDKNIAHLLLIENKYPYHIVKCSFVGNDIIFFYYPKNELNKKYLYVISKIDENLNCCYKYLLIYNDAAYQKGHFENIKLNIFNFKKNLSFYNNACPIVTNGLVIIAVSKLNQ